MKRVKNRGNEKLNFLSGFFLSLLVSILVFAIPVISSKTIEDFFRANLIFYTGLVAFIGFIIWAGIKISSKKKSFGIGLLIGAIIGAMINLYVVISNFIYGHM